MKNQPIPTPATLAISALADIVDKIEFNKAWLTAVNYVDGAVTGPLAPVLKIGEVKSSVDAAGRKYLFCGTELGNVIAFTASAHGKATAAWQCSEVMDGFIVDLLGAQDGQAPVELIQALFNDGADDTIGHKFAAAPEEQRKVLLGLFNANETMKVTDAPAAATAAAPEVDPAATPAAPAAEAKSTETKPKEAKMKSTTTTKTESKDLTAWGVFWRVSGVAVLIIAIIVAIAFGMHFGAAYIAGLGLGQGVTIALGYLLTIGSYIGVGFVVAKGVDFITSLFGRRKPAAPVATPAAA